MEKAKVSAIPAKKFFVEMLTRDIDLKDAILDLIDNSLDGAMRQLNNKNNLKNNDAYKNFHSKLYMNENEFIIQDNCGGISEKIALTKAFRLGNTDYGDDSELPTIGVYGIGMKRAMFKMGRHSKVSTRTNDNEYSVTITPDWLEKDDDWHLPLEYNSDKLEEIGTKIHITKLRDGVSRLLGDEVNFQSDLIHLISYHFAIVINKGFKIYINDKEIKPNLTALLFDKSAFEKNDGITPYIYDNYKDGVNIQLAVGFYRDLSTEEEDESSLESKNSSEKAGWTIICNDRVVVYADKTRLTGWGEAGVPSYHTQFIGIAGVVKFSSNDASKLPVTTTKRGIDGNSELYLAVKDYMRDGLKTFTIFTNKWKSYGSSKGTVTSFSNASINASSSEITDLIPHEKWKINPKEFGGRIYKPHLPIPKISDKVKNIKFSVDYDDFLLVAEHLFDNPNTPASELGKKCFEIALNEAIENE
ncbi:Uncharacterised protein [Serratia quinivorans]|uniref:ATP-binding protein n=1 Tax=Serratia quinivorans TaxID=137545 RepID=UPI00217CC1BA|nr:ATP-binding protein [Serratia quinivorans]CAI1870848.1 Uncharacterised protein [Serratia quinivorans]